MGKTVLIRITSEELKIFEHLLQLLHESNHRAQKAADEAIEAMKEYRAFKNAHRRKENGNLDHSL